ncbi:flagellar basal body P-ring formation chaperone FlgA [Henriciella marina]|uniref:flagellar basal body P-ring formation chaperone FlgA n=1 Tax=Henriciella marina TaxID=453851 RepID=UPI00037BD020|nr:flagellar basal body P-ring formation chaperone FlgA [Henriciella marina]
MSILSTLAGGLFLAMANSGSVVANDVIRSGSAITPAMIATEDGAPVYDSPLIGREVRRTVYAGKEVTMDNTQSPRLVSRNQVVTVKFIQGGLEISTTARAMEEGGLNDTVSVLNINSRKMVTGVVQSGGWVLAQ